jgi:hypothetical protein
MGIFHDQFTFGLIDHEFGGRFYINGGVLLGFAPLNPTYGTDW